MHMKSQLTLFTLIHVPDHIVNNSSEQVIPKKNGFNQNVKTHSEISFTFSSTLVDLRVRLLK